MCRCRKCGFKNFDKAVTCIKCGEALPIRTQNGASGERREVAVLVLSVESLATVNHLNSEEKYLITDELMHLLVDIVYEHEGIIDKLTDDGMLAIFGVPTIHENDSERAIRTALAMLQQLKHFNQRINQKYRTDIHIRMGIHTGWIMVGTLSTETNPVYNIVGNTLALAAKLQVVADTDTLLVSADTHKRAKSFFIFKNHPPIPLKNNPNPITVFQPIDVRAFPGKVRGFFGFQIPLVGRTTEILQLNAQLQSTIDENTPHVVFVTGEAGIGKSRLVAEFSQSIENTISVFEGHCYNYARTKPFSLMTNLLRDIIHLSEMLPPKQQSRSIRNYLQTLNVPINDIFPYVAEILDIPTDIDDQSSPSPKLDSAVLQRLIFAALRHLLIAESETKPIVLILDDLHWIDAASQRFLLHLIQTVTQHPILLILVSRHNENENILQALREAANQHNPIEILLNPLSTIETSSLVEALVNCKLPNANQIFNRLANRATGNPFFVEEIVRSLIEQGTLISENNRWWLNTTDEDSLYNLVPDTLNGLIMARYDRLTPEVQQTLRIAAVLGTSFSVDILYDFNNLDINTLNQYLAELVQRSFLVKDESVDYERYRFSHTLFQEIIYKILLSRDRQKLHYHAAQIFAKSPSLSIQERDEALAFHYFRSLKPKKALPYLLTTADYAVRRSANDVAIQYFRQALSLMDDGIESEEQVWLTQLKLGQALKFTGQYAEASEILEGALQQLLYQSLKITSQTILPVLVNALRELADIRTREGKMDEAVSHLQAGLDALGEDKAQRHSTHWFLLIERLAWVRFRQGNLDKAFSLANWATMESEGEHDDTPIVMASLFNTLGGIFWQWGNQAKAVVYVSLSLEHYKKLNYAWGMGTAYANLGVLYSTQGLWKKSLHYLEKAYTLRRDNGYIPELAPSLYNLGLLRQSMGDHAQAQRDFTQSLEISQRIGDNFGIAFAKIGLGYHALLENELPTALEYIEAVLSIENDIPDEYIAQAAWIKGLIQAEQGNIEEGIETVERALELTQSAKLTEQEGKSLRALAILKTRMGHYFDAEILFREAIDLFLQINIPYWQAMTLLEMGKMYQRRADDTAQNKNEWLDKAQQNIEEARQHFERLGAAYDQQQAEEALQVIKDVIATEQASPLVQNTSKNTDQSSNATWHTIAVLWLKLSTITITDEETVFEAMASIVPEITAIATEFQGKLTRRHDALMVVFGAPIAYEDDAERAIYAASQMMSYLGDFSQSNHFHLDYGATISLGKAIAGKMGTQRHSEFVVQGEIVQLSQQMAQRVPIGHIWVTDSVKQATERVFQFSKITSEVKPAQTDKTLWVLDSFKTAPLPARGVPGIHARLVGRTEILQKMSTLAEQLPQGIGGLIWLEGEPGIGKSRLMQEFTNKVSDEKIMLLAGKCSPQKSNQAFSIFSDLLARAFNINLNDSQEIIYGQVEHFYKSLPSTVQMTRPYIESLLGIPPSGGGGQRLLALEPQQLRQQIFVAFRRLFQGISRQQSMVIVLDDLHWVDPISAELIQFLMTLVATSPILFVCAQRRQGSDAPNDRLVKAQSLMPLQTLRFRLERLSTTESETLIHDLLPNAKLPKKVCKLIVSYSEGNPYFIEEFVRVLIEQDYLQRQEGKWRVSPTIQIDELSLPSSLETLIRSRIDALPTELQQVVQAAAVVHEPFDVPLLESLTQSSDVSRTLARLESRLLIRRGTTKGEWFFSHSLIQGVAYHAILKNQRQNLHLIAATTLSDRWGNHATDHAKTLAYHFSQAGDRERALPYLVLAGERALARFANDESLDYFRQAEESWGTNNNITDFHWRVAVGMGDAYRHLGQYSESIAAFQSAESILPSKKDSAKYAIQLYRRWGETARKQGDYLRALELFRRALTSLQTQRDTTELQFERVRILTGMALVHLVQGEFELAQQTAETSLSEAKKIDAIGEMAAAENLLGGLFYRRRSWTLALHHTMRAMVFREQVGYSWGVAGTLSNLGILAVSAGHWDKARSFFERSLALRDDLGDVEGMAIVHNNLGTLAKDQGELDIAEQYFQKSLNLARQFKMGWQISNSTIGLGRVLLLKKRFDNAKEIIASSLAQAESIGAEDIKVEIYYTQAELFLVQSALSEAKQAAKKALTQAQKVGNRVSESPAWQTIAEIERRNKQFLAAWQAVEKADALLAEGADELEIARLTYIKGRIALDEDDEVRARTYFRTAKEVFMRLGANLDIKRIEQLLKTAF